MNKQDGGAGAEAGCNPGATSILSFAALPVFASMAVASASGGEPWSPMCGGAGTSHIFNSMSAMYALMAVFHAGPWLRVLGGVFNLRGCRGDRSLTIRRHW